MQAQRRRQLDQPVVSLRAGGAAADVRYDRLAGSERELPVNQQRQLLATDVLAHPLTARATAVRAAAIRERTVPTGTDCNAAISS